MRLILLTIIFLNCWLSPTCATEFSLGVPFSENAVLQRKKPIKIFGGAAANSIVYLSLADKKSSTKVKPDGTWLVTLNPIKAGGPYLLKVSNGMKSIKLHVYIGDVWLAAGQSNLVWFVDSSMNAEKNIAEANKFTNKIFFLNMNRKPEEKPLSPFAPVNNRWINISSQNAKASPALPYAFAREIYKNQKVPIGIIQAATSNTMIQTHMSKKSLASYKDLEKLKANELKNKTIWHQTVFGIGSPANSKLEYFTICLGDPKHQNYLTAFLNEAKLSKNFVSSNCNEFHITALNKINKLQIRVFPNQLQNTTLDEITEGINKSKMIFGRQELFLNQWSSYPEISINTPSSNFNIKINPVTLYPIKGVIWYQGEANINDYSSYKELFTSLVQDWRDRWHENLPFLTVQLHNFKTEHPENILKFRKVQAQLSKELPNVYMVDAFPFSNKDLDVHPANKDAVGYKLAELAIQKVYSK